MISIMYPWSGLMSSSEICSSNINENWKLAQVFRKLHVLSIGTQLLSIDQSIQCQLVVVIDVTLYTRHVRDICLVLCLSPPRIHVQPYYTYYM
jgi:hypothetical protein